VALFIFKKNKLWIWKAYCRETGALIDWECGNRDRKTFAKLMERLKRWKVEIYCADHWDVYVSEISPEKLIQGKAHTVSIERNNGRQRHWFARFRRKAIAVSRSLHMVDLTMALFARFHVNGNREDIKTLFA
jgi:insertion element IS1 protein InsB